jgi:hypothetical protein
VNNGLDNGAGGDADHLASNERRDPAGEHDDAVESHGTGEYEDAGDIEDPDGVGDIESVDWEKRVAEASDEMEQEAAASGSPSKLDAWRRRSAAGAILTGIARGLQGVFEKEKEEPSITQETSGDPPKDLPVEADVQQGRARHSVVNIRPWLLHRHAGDADHEKPHRKGDGDPGGFSDPGSPGAGAGEGT